MLLESGVIGETVTLSKIGCEVFEKESLGASQ